MQPPPTSEEKLDHMVNFETMCDTIHHKYCKACHRVSINLTVNSRGFCNGHYCKFIKTRNHYVTNKVLPLWFDGDQPMFHVPQCLKDLGTTEQLLIQKYSPFVPLHHIKNGTMGISGHCCAFEADLEGFVNTLPRRKNDITLLRVLKKVKSEIGGNNSDYSAKLYTVRKKEVYDALTWLKQHNQDYKSINIDLTALDWVDESDGVFDGHVIETEEMRTTEDNTPQNADIGPAPDQANAPTPGDENIGTFGYIDEGQTRCKLSLSDETINDELRDAVSRSTNKSAMNIDWPKISSKPIDEFSEIRLFTGAFPWLFPGGYGDPKDYPGSLADWGRHMNQYEDARFAKDKIFCFFALNHIVRMRNSTLGRWFIDNFHKGLPQTLDELKDRIVAGDGSFVRNLNYYNRSITGSGPYWFKKRCELHSWINHHVETGSGAPTMFITLSCAEYLWRDMVDMVRERMEIAGDDTTNCYIGKKGLVSIMNDYSIVVQEYFQHRVTKWLETVGKTIFNIKHYWVRFEFAPGRGQIHAHLLAIPEDHSIYQLCHLDLKQANGQEKRAQRMAAWADEYLGLTASVDEDFENPGMENLASDVDSPVSMRFTDVCDLPNGPDACNIDFQRLMKATQTHTCSGFCMRAKSTRYVTCIIF